MDLLLIIIIAIVVIFRIKINIKILRIIDGRQEWQMKR